jgi:hypothetical protein
MLHWFLDTLRRLLAITPVEEDTVWPQLRSYPYGPRQD